MNMFMMMKVMLLLMEMILRIKMYMIVILSINKFIDGIKNKPYEDFLISRDQNTANADSCFQLLSAD